MCGGNKTHDRESKNRLRCIVLQVTRFLSACCMTSLGIASLLVIIAKKTDFSSASAAGTNHQCIVNWASNAESMDSTTNGRPIVAPTHDNGGR